ncbi:MAG TPA: protein-L-isoaspartate(D-aspartate) O-methyltransferase [Pirellulaceae bacterium]|nr:protein-L-isoaspartate(D-aspartate) O-methyltransferase [Pirellulaceae bacterium]
MIRNPMQSPDESLSPAYFDLARQQMVEYQLRRRGIGDERVLSAMASVAREKFVPPDLWHAAYDDGALPIGWDQTISQPLVVAYMAEALQLRPGDKLLEIGTGSGYGAAVLSLLAREVHTVERLAPLADRAKDALERLVYENVHVHLSDGTVGLRAEAPFDAICVTAGAREIPQPLLDQLAEGGRLVIPVGPLHNQRMQRITRRGDDFLHEDLGAFAFVPLIGEHGWPE